MIAKPAKPVDWTALDAVRVKADAELAMDEEKWQALFAEALKATSGQRAPAIDLLALYGRPEWVTPPSTP